METLVILFKLLKGSSKSEEYAQREQPCKEVIEQAEGQYRDWPMEA